MNHKGSHQGTLKSARHVGGTFPYPSPLRSLIVCARARDFVPAAIYRRRRDARAPAPLRGARAPRRQLPHPHPRAPRRAGAHPRVVLGDHPGRTKEKSGTDLLAYSGVDGAVCGDGACADSGVFDQYGVERGLCELLGDADVLAGWAAV